ncbi:MAG: DUF192 domain-containing protein [Candidatus Nanohaloarchaea archaeon]
MRVLNRDTGTVIPDVEVKESVWEKFVGLRFRSEGRAFFRFDRDVYAPFDMMFVRTPLDIAFLDDEMQVMEIHGAYPLTPDPYTWRLYRPDDPYRYVLETEQGMLVDHGYEPGHELAVLD